MTKEKDEFEEALLDIKPFKFLNVEAASKLRDRLRVAHKKELESAILNAEYHQSMREMG